MPNPTLSDRLSPRESWRPQREPSLIGPQTKRLAGIAAAVLAVVAMGAGGLALLSGRSHTVPVIEPDSRPIRVKPDNPGGMQLGEDEGLMDAAADSGAETMAPSPEAPAPEVLAAQIEAAHRSAAPAEPAPPPQAAAASPAIAAPMLASPPIPAAAVAPAARVAVRPALTDGRLSGDRVVQVQLAAMTTHEGAMAEWDRLAKKMPELLGPHHPAVVQTVVDGKTFFRLRTGGFADGAAAASFCAEVHAKGGACNVAAL